MPPLIGRAMANLSLSLGPARLGVSPYFDSTLKWGAQAFTVYNHMLMPTVYESAEADYNYIVGGVTLWDVAGQRQVEIRGPDAAAFAQYLTPRNLGNFAPGRCRYAVITDTRGGVVNDPILLRLADDCIWLSAADADLLLWCRGIAHGGKFNVSINEPEGYPLQLQGPRAIEAAADIFGEWILDLGYFHLREFEWGGTPLLMSRTGWSGELGFEIYLRDSSRGDWLWESIMSAGEKYGIKPASPSSIRRIEGGLISYRADATLDDNPYELGLERLVDLDGGFDFVGKSALQRIHRQGANRKLVGVIMDGEPFPSPNARWWDAHVDGKKIGEVRSAVYSPNLKKNIGMAMLQISSLNSPSRIEVRTEHGERGAGVCDLPFIESRARNSVGANQK